MPAEMSNAISSLIETFANLDLRGAPLLCLMMCVMHKPSVLPQEKQMWSLPPMPSEWE